MRCVAIKTHKRSSRDSLCLKSTASSARMGGTQCQGGDTGRRLPARVELEGGPKWPLNGRQGIAESDPPSQPMVSHPQTGSVDGIHHPSAVV